ncbi:MAG: adenosylcobinamide-GDP ribazoletransferase [Spirochaetia bacterium]|nr:adenosylcobinamide-GDP ribazoletransferase [Spirochaetia bacterium]
MKSLFTAISLLSILPLPQKLSSNVKNCSVYFPLVGFVLGFLYYGIGMALNLINVSADWTGLIILCTMAIITGALHLDGLADTADGFFGGKTKDHILVIMKDSATGTFGAVALFLLLLIKWTALVHISNENNFWIIIPVVVLSRTAMTISAGLFQYARSNGTGHDIVSNTSFKSVILTITYTTLLMILFFGFASLILMAMSITFSFLIGFYSRYKINGITGDVLGATCEISEGLMLAVVPFLQNYFFPDQWSFIIS